MYFPNFYHHLELPNDGNITILQRNHPNVSYENIQITCEMYVAPHHGFGTFSCHNI